MQKTKNIIAGLDVKLNNSASLYHCIISFIICDREKMSQKNTFKLRFGNVYEIMEMAGGEIFLRSDKLVKLAGDQVSCK